MPQPEQPSIESLSADLLSRPGRMLEFELLRWPYCGGLGLSIEGVSCGGRRLSKSRMLRVCLDLA